YTLIEAQYLLQLSVNRAVNTTIISQRILQIYPEILQRFRVQQQLVWDLLEIKANQELNIELFPKMPIQLPNQLSWVERRQRLYQEVVVQIQRIIICQAPEQFLESVERLLNFLREQNISTEEIQKKALIQVIRKRAAKDLVFLEQLRQWQETADQTARFSVVGQAIHFAIAFFK
ncbi:MAG: low-complexity protein, partial [Coleofasciculaceae cyanobacterium]